MILVSILGDFHSSILPIFFEYKKKITHHIILHDDSSHDKKQIKKLLKAQKNFLETYEEDGIAILSYKINRLQISEDNYDDIVKAFQVLTSLVKKPKDIYLNATDGLSSMGIILSNKVLQYGGNVISYDRYANTYNIHTKNSMKKKNIKNNIDIKNHLKLKGYKLLKYTNKFELKNRKVEILELSKNLKEYKKFAANYPNHEPHHEYYNSLIKQINIPKKQRKFFIDGVVFEEYIYWLIKDNCDIDDIMTGVSIQFNEGFKNEIDILIMKNNHLHTIECKYTKNFKSSEYVYKTDSIMSHLDDDNKGMILVIGEDDFFTNGDKFRANNNDILLHSVKRFNKDKFLKQIKTFFNLDTK